MNNVSRLPEPTATIDLTFTMLDKCIIDANATVRGDRRVSISKLKSIAGSGDTVAITMLDGVVVINLTKVDQTELNGYLNAMGY